MPDSWETTLDLSDVEDVGVLWSAVSNFEADLRRRAVAETDPIEARDLREIADRALNLLRRIGGPGAVEARAGDLG